jgi:hypothetical protein
MQAGTLSAQPRSLPFTEAKKKDFSVNNIGRQINNSYQIKKESSPNEFKKIGECV